MIVPIEQVIPLHDHSSPTAVRKMKAVLEKQGQIVPLQVRRISDDCYVVFHADPWANELIRAAHELGWTTLLITEMRRYEE
jgi:hypothetical protein